MGSEVEAVADELERLSWSIDAHANAYHREPVIHGVLAMGEEARALVARLRAALSRTEGAGLELAEYLRGQANAYADAAFIHANLADHEQVQPMLERLAEKRRKEAMAELSAVAPAPTPGSGGAEQNPGPPHVDDLARHEREIAETVERQRGRLAEKFAPGSGGGRASLCEACAERSWTGKCDACGAADAPHLVGSAPPAPEVRVCGRQEHCVVCGADMLPPDAPPHCYDCSLTQEHWDAFLSGREE